MKETTRRDFLRGATGVAWATLAAGRPVAAAQPVRAIDTHTHFYNPTRPQGVPWPPPGDTLLYQPHLPGQFGALTNRLGVVGTVVVEASAWVEDNQWILDLAKDHPLIVGFIGHLEPGQPEFAANLRRFSRNALFRGLRFGEQVIARGIGQRAFEDDLRRMADAGLALDVLGGAAMLPNVAQMAKLAPKLRFVIDHLPFDVWGQDVAAMRRTLAEVAALPNVYAKVSNVVRRMDGRVMDDPKFYRPGLDLLWELFGPDRALYGSNWPVSNRVAPYESVHRVVADYVNSKGQRVAEKFFWRNSLAAYRWQPRGEAKGLAL